MSSDDSAIEFRNPKSDNSGCLTGCLVFLGVCVAFTLIPLLAFLVVAPTFGVLFNETARSITGGATAAMAVSGWLICYAGGAAIGALVLWHRRLGKWLRVTAGVVAGVLALTAISYLPSRDWDPVELVSGVGGAAFLVGAHWGLLAGAITLALAWLAAKLRKEPDHGRAMATLLGVAVAVAATSLVVAVVRV
ncbi:hypothetical protein AB0M02_08325 [Actinoplanes sp. NPDC051861]|uniref:hypothetical protein n=1 Tax=Actinoplanes sp. NPDC051861 TaxID=3155170 RepID=UPI0034394385